LLLQIVQFFAVATIAWFGRMLTEDKVLPDDKEAVEDTAKPGSHIEVAIADEAGAGLAHDAHRQDYLLFHSFLTSENALRPRADQEDLSFLSYGEPLVMLVRLGELAVLPDAGGGDRHGRDHGAWAVDSSDFFVFVM
jgi:hypothetical protein